MTSDADLAYSSITELAPRVRSGELSPVALVENSLARIDELEGSLNAFIEVYEDDALDAARALEQSAARGDYRGPLHGMPIALKDLIDVSGKVTTGGSRILRDNVAASDATVTRRLTDAGAIILGKLNLVEFALGAAGLNAHYGPAHNPWGTDRITAGSSSGSGAAVAAGIVYGALGSDTGGSIRMPAALCGIAGLKPTYGRVSRAGVLDLSWSCDHVGPMTRRVSDTAHMMTALAGHDPADPASSHEPAPHFPDALGAGLEGVRIGVPRDYFFDDLDPEIEDAVRTAIAVMESNGATAVDVEMPWVSTGRSINLGVMLPEALSVHERWLRERRDEYGPTVRARLEAAIGISAADYIRAQRARRQFNERMAEAMRSVDVLVTSTVPVQTPTIAECMPTPGEAGDWASTRLPIFTGIFDVTGTPSLSVNCGFTAGGMPIGLMISGKPFDEVMVLRVGDAYETLAGWWRRRPPLDSRTRS